MIIRRLRLINFRQHEDTELILGAGLTGIIGPNGAGKTTLLEAIAWAIYGTPAARGNRDSILRLRAPPRSPVRVELEFTLGPHNYHVVRTLHSAELYQDGDPSPIVISIGGVSERLERILGMTREEFFNTYFTSQKELAVMAAMSAPERAQFLSRVLGYEKIRAAQNRLKERRTALRSRFQALQGTLPDAALLESDFDKARLRLEEISGKVAAARTSLDTSEQHLALVQPRWESIQRLKEQVASLEGDLRVAEHGVSAAGERHQQLDRQLAEALTARDRLGGIVAQLEPLAGLRAERESLDARYQSVAARRGFQNQLTDLRSRFAEIAKELEAIPAPDVIAGVMERQRKLTLRRDELASTIDQRQTEW
ncbi:MAG: AAA family ATPase, partial [Gemmatimonadales bacterium]